MKKLFESAQITLHKVSKIPFRMGLVCGSLINYGCRITPTAWAALREGTVTSLQREVCDIVHDIFEGISDFSRMDSDTKDLERHFGLIN